MKTSGPPCSSPPAQPIRKQPQSQPQQQQAQPQAPISITGVRPTPYVLIAAFLILAGVLYGEDLACILNQPLQQLHQIVEEYGQTANVTAETTDDAGGGIKKAEDAAFTTSRSTPLPFAVGRLREQGSDGIDSSCDLFSGTWVLDEASRPHYREEECPYIQPQVTCRKMGRPDDKYQKWRWQPHGCTIPSFNASFMLEKIRGKRVLYVGDSLNRGQFTSMVCLLQQGMPQHARSFNVNGSMTTFIAKEYNVTVQFYWAPFLAESNSDNAIVHRVSNRIIRAGSVKKHAVHWKGADIIVFNTYMWWMTGVSMKILRGPFSGDMRNIRTMEVEDSYRIALRTMVRWVEKNMDPNMTRVFFTSMSPAHERSAEWGDEPGGNCLNQTEPIKDPNYWGFSSSKSVMRVLGEELARSRVPFTLLNITQLSDYRKDAHNSIYKKQWQPLTPEQLANPKSYADCVHWCLPGLQDTWNELLYAKLFFP